MPVVRPVIDKVATIISRHIEGHDVDAIALVGGTCCFTGIEGVIESAPACQRTSRKIRCS